MSEFWFSKTTMKALYGDDYTAFTIGSPTWAFWIILEVLVCVGGFILYRRADEQKRRRLLTALMIFILFDEAVKHITMLATGQYEWMYLPFQLCSINIFICLWYTIRPNRIAAEFLYSLCLPSAVIALIMPIWTALPIWNIMHLHSCTIHIALALFPMLLLAGDFKPTLRLFPQTAGLLTVMAIPVYFLNRLLGTNFMFLSGPDNNPALALIARLTGRFYPIGVWIMLLLVCVLMNLPWEVWRKRR